MSTTLAAARPAPTGRGPAAWSRADLIGWAFALFNSLRMVAYLPTLWAIHLSGDSSQHSLWTWGTWLGANLSMAAWLHEHNGRRGNRAVAVSLCNALMCAAAVVLIAVHRF